MQERAAQRWSRRLRDPDLILVQQPGDADPVVVVQVEKSVEIDASPELVWDFVWRPETAVLTDPDVVQGFTVPGTPQGQVGERQCFVSDDGDNGLRTTVIEVIELVPGQTATIMRVPTNATRVTTTVVGAGDRAALAVRFVGLSRQSGAQALAEEAGRYHGRYLRLVQQHIEAGWQQTPRGRHASHHSS
jgi:hypothetical protein